MNTHDRSTFSRVPALWPFPILAIVLLQLSVAFGETGTFIDRDLTTDLRVVSYNVLWNTIFSQENPIQAAKFERIVQAIDADIWNLQEIGPDDNPSNPTDDDVVDLMNTIMPLPGGATWYGHQSWDNVIVSRYPLSMLAYDTIPEPSATSVAMALVELPDAQFDTDFYVMNNHFKCCGSVGSWEDTRRQEQADALVNWIRDARTPGGNIGLPAETPMVVVGDLNIVGSLQPLNTIVTGNIINEGTYGSDSQPDWDGSSLTDAHPLHNGSGPDDYTWRSDYSIYDPGRLDYVIYSDSALDVGNRFVLNTVDMSSAERAATGLQRYDITIDSIGEVYDHLPLVVDFRMFDFADSDFNFSRSVDRDDLAIWETGFSSAGTSHAQGDADGDGDVDGFDFLRWQREYNGTLSSLTAVPEPTTLALLLMSGLCAGYLHRSHVAYIGSSSSRNQYRSQSFGDRT